MRKSIHWIDMAWVVTAVFFLLGFVHITFSLLGMICMILPFILFFRTNDKVWCKRYCPRASLFVKALSKVSLSRKLPKGLTSQDAKRIVLVYFGINLFFATMSTIMVSIGRIAPIDYLRFLIAFPVPFEMPQLITLTVPDTLLHLSYRIYSMMMTSTAIGFLLGFLYMPRTWCVICPIQTLTTVKKVN